MGDAGWGGDHVVRRLSTGRSSYLSFAPRFLAHGCAFRAGLRSLAQCGLHGPSPHVGTLLYFLPPSPYAQHTTVWGESARPRFAEETLNDFIKATESVQSAPGSAALPLPTHPGKSSYETNVFRAVGQALF